MPFWFLRARKYLCLLPGYLQPPWPGVSQRRQLMTVQVTLRIASIEGDWGTHWGCFGSRLWEPVPGPRPSSNQAPLLATQPELLTSHRNISTVTSFLVPWVELDQAAGVYGRGQDIWIFICHSNLIPCWLAGLTEAQWIPPLSFQTVLRLPHRHAVQARGDSVLGVWVSTCPCGGLQNTYASKSLLLFLHPVLNAFQCNFPRKACWCF